MPGLTIATDARPDPAPARRTSTSTNTNPRRTSSPPRPPVSPITPTLGPSQLPTTGGPGGPAFAPTRQPSDSSNSNSNNNSIPDFALGRPAFSHTQPDQVAIAPPPAQPINFDENPDVIALKSAISILQLQRARATADIQALNRAKTAALADPSAFIADLAARRVGTEGDPLFLETNDSDDDDDDEEEEDGEEEHVGQGPTPSSGTGAKTDGGTDNDTPMTDGSVGTPAKKRKGKQSNSGSNSNNDPASDGAGGAANTAAAAWRKLPKPQNVVRCPPINWAQYGVVGGSLDKLHAEQVAAPTPGAPVALGPGGTYEFKAGSHQAAASAAGEQQPRRLVGIAAPYTPGKDRLEKKGKGGKR